MLTGNIPQNLRIYCAMPKTLQKSYWDDFEYNESDVGMSVMPSFATDAENKKTQETAKTWAGKKQTVVERPNLNLDNLRLVSLEKRSEGGRAWKIVTEDGMWFDLREDVLLDTLQNCSVKNGVIKASFVFAVVGSQMKLIRVGSELYKRVQEYMNRKQQKPIPVSDFVFGHCYENKKGDPFLYLGQYDANIFEEGSYPPYKKKCVVKRNCCLIVPLKTWMGKRMTSALETSSCDVKLVKSPEYIKDNGFFPDADKAISMYLKQARDSMLESLKKGSCYSFCPSPHELLNGRKIGEEKFLYTNYDDFLQAMKSQL